MEFAVGHYLDLKTAAGSTYQWQNFWIKETVSGYSFIPFGFSGSTVNRQGDNIDARLVFPNNELTRQWAVSCITESWLATVKVVLFDPDNKATQNTLHTYVGQAASGAWDDTALNVRLNTMIDAVGGDVPARRLTRDLVGHVPISAAVRLQ